MAGLRLPDAFIFLFVLFDAASATSTLDGIEHVSLQNLPSLVRDLHPFNKSLVHSEVKVTVTTMQINVGASFQRKITMCGLSRITVE